MIGPNGAGKSTLLKAVYGLVTRTGGTVRFDGEDVTGVRADRLTRRGLNFVPQTDNVFPTLTVAENVHVGSLVVPKARARRGASQRVRELFPILARAAAPARRHALGRPAQAGRARAGARDAARGCCCSTSRRPGSRRSRWSSSSTSCVEINELGIGIVMVEQNARRALALAHRGYVLDAGRNAIEGSGADLLHDPRVTELYLGGSGTIASSSTSTSTPSGMNPETK